MTFGVWRFALFSRVSEIVGIVRDLSAVALAKVDDGVVSVSFN